MSLGSDKFHLNVGSYGVILHVTKLEERHVVSYTVENHGEPVTTSNTMEGVSVFDKIKNAIDQVKEELDEQSVDGIEELLS